MPLRLPYRPPFHAASVFGFLGMRAVPGVEAWEPSTSTYSRVLRLPNGFGVVSLSPASDYVECVLRLDDTRDLAAAVQRCRRLLDLDADPVAVDTVLVDDPALADLVATAPGRRAPGHVDGAELAVRAILGQQVSVAGARTIAGRLAALVGDPVPFGGGLDRVFPTPVQLLELPDDALPMPASRRRALRTMCGALASGDIVIDPGVDATELRRRLLELNGIGPWTADYIVMRALGAPDGMPPPLEVSVMRHARSSPPPNVGARGAPMHSTISGPAWKEPRHDEAIDRPSVRRDPGVLSSTESGR